MYGKFRGHDCFSNSYHFIYGKDVPVQMLEITDIPVDEDCVTDWSSKSGLKTRSLGLNNTLGTA